MRRSPPLWQEGSSSWHTILLGDRVRSRDSPSAPHWSGLATPVVAVETGSGIRPEQDGPEQGVGRPGPGRAGKPPARWLRIMDGFPAVIRSSRCANDQNG